MRTDRRILCLFFAALLVAPAPLSAQPKPDPKLKEESKRLFGPPQPPTPPGQAPSAPEGESKAGGWSIMLAVYRGDTAPQEAATLLQQIQSKGQLPGAYLQTRGPSTVIVAGSFADSASPDAQAELKRIRELVVSGATPYASAFLIPPPTGGIPGSLPEMDLRNARDKYGPTAKHTLEVGYYGRNDTTKPTPTELTEFRKAAEDAAAKLRQAGELAFYFHGPNRSSVTVGLFDETDSDPQTPSFRSARLTEARKLHPYHLFNGEAYRIKGRSVEKAGFVPCPLVKIPASDKPDAKTDPARKP